MSKCEYATLVFAVMFNVQNKKVGAISASVRHRISLIADNIVNPNSKHSIY